MFSQTALDHIQSPRNRGELPGANRYGVEGVPGDGPSVEIWLRVEEGKILAASYQTHGCPSSMAASSMVAQIVTGRTPEQASLLTQPDLLLILGGLPAGKEMFATMAIRALQKALADPSQS
jgi:NifU-like protein